MATDKAFYIDGTQIAPNILSSAVLTNGVYRTLVEIDNGSVKRNIWEDERPLLDGMRRRGSVFGTRDMEWKIRSLVNVGAVSAANIERVRDDEEDRLLSLLLKESGLLTLKVTRQSYPTTPVSRVIYADAAEVRAWKWEKTSLDDGLVGRHDMPVLIMTVPFHCPFPWWIDESATASALLNLTASAQTVVITNNGDRSCGLKFNVEGTGSGLTIEVKNITTGLSATIGGGGVKLNNVTLHATNGHVVDQYVDDPQRFQAYREADGSSIMAKLSPRPRAWLAKGSNTIQYQIIAGTPAGDEKIQFWHRAWWGAP